MEEWQEMEENCLLKELAICFEEVRILGPKEMGWLGGGEEFFPERDLRRDQYLEGLEESDGFLAIFVLGNGLGDFFIESLDIRVGGV